MAKKVKLSIVVLSFNTKSLLRSCIRSLEKTRGEINFELIVVDNGSEDGSVEMVKKSFPWVKLIENKSNLGFAKGNNSARKICKGKYVLFLNSDTEVYKQTLSSCIDYYEKHSRIGSLSCKLVLPNGDLDKDCRRSFPTPWVALTHFSGLDRLFPKSRLFSKYWYGFFPDNETNEVDSIQGAFFLVKRELLDKVDWFDEDYFIDGEDIDLCWKIKNRGFKNIYFPEVSILHIKKGSKKKTRIETNIIEGVRSMEIFYKKRLWNNYPVFLNYAVLGGIRLIKALRLLKLKLL